MSKTFIIHVINIYIFQEKYRFLNILIILCFCIINQYTSLYVKSKLLI